MAYPEPLPPPEDIFQARSMRSAAIVRIAAIGIATRFFIAAFEFWGYLFSQSSALLVDALSTVVDVVSSLLLIVSIKLAERPPDREHPFGHGRYEPLVGLQLGLFITLGGVVMFFYQLQAFWNLEKSHYLNPNVWLFPLIACLLLELAYLRMKRIAKEHNSPALKSEALHFRVDSLNSLLALVALIAGVLLPEWGWVCDRLGALLISLFMFGIGLYASKSNLNQLLDRIPHQAYFEKVRQAAKSVEGIKDTEKIRIQLSGPVAHVDIDVEVDPELSVEKAHSLCQKVRFEIQKVWPQVQDVIVHVEPYYENDH